MARGKADGGQLDADMFSIASSWTDILTIDIAGSLSLLSFYIPPTIQLSMVGSTVVATAFGATG